MLDGVVPFPSEFVERYRAKGYWEDRSLASVFADVFTRFAERVALVAGSERIIYRELAGRVERLARHFLKLEIRPLDRVVVQLPNVPELVYVYFALQRVGAIPAMAKLRSTPWTPPCSSFRVAPPACPSSSRGCTTTTSTTRRRRRRWWMCGPTTRCWWCCRSPTISRWPVPVSRASSFAVRARC